MPYSSNSELPPPVRNSLPGAAQSVFRSVVNSSLAAGRSDERAHRQAWAVVHRSWKKPKGEGKWSKKGAVGKLKAPVHAPVYVCRDLVNTGEFVAWAKAQGFPTVIDPKDLHVTIAYSRKSMDWPTPQNNRLVMRASGTRKIQRLGDKGAVVLRFDSPILSNRWGRLKTAGASWDYGNQYKPHVTISYKVPEDFDLSSVEPYKGKLIFGPEHVRALQDNNEYVEKLRESIHASGSAATFKTALALYNDEGQVTKYDCQLLKAENKKLGLIFGWAIVSSENGKPYYDTQGDHIPDESMLRAAAEFMESKRTMKIMHGGKKVGTVVFAWPMTQEIADAMGVKGNRTGLMIAVKPDNPNVLERFRTNQYTGFSIGGNRLIDKDVDGDDEEAAAMKALSFGQLKSGDNSLFKATSFSMIKAGWEESKHPRDQHGKWSVSGVAHMAAIAGLSAASLAGAAGLGVRGARALLPAIRRAVLAARFRGARSAVRTGLSTGQFGGRHANYRAMRGALGARGYENRGVNALRNARNIQSGAARRRRLARTGPRGIHAPWSLGG